MSLPIYLARSRHDMPEDAIAVCYIGCHLSETGTGICRLPHSLPPGSLFTVDDRILPHGHDMALVYRQLSDAVSRFSPAGIILDFEAPFSAELMELAATLSALPCPVAVSPAYSSGLSCPVFLPPIPPDESAKSFLAPWKGRELWLEAEAESVLLTLDKSGCEVCPTQNAPCEPSLADRACRCHYRTDISDVKATVHIGRTYTDTAAVLDDAAALGVTRAITVSDALFYFLAQQHTML